MTSWLVCRLHPVVSVVCVPAKRVNEARRRREVDVGRRWPGGSVDLDVVQSGLMDRPLSADFLSYPNDDACCAVWLWYVALVACVHLLCCSLPVPRLGVVVPSAVFLHTEDGRTDWRNAHSTTTQLPLHVRRPTTLPLLQVVNSSSSRSLIPIKAADNEQLVRLSMPPPQVLLHAVLAGR